MLKQLARFSGLTSLICCQRRDIMMIVIHRMIIQKSLRYRTMAAEFLVITEKTGSVAGFLACHNILEQNTA